VGNVSYFILTGEPSNRVRPIFPVNNNGHSLEIGELKDITDREVPYKGGGTVVFGVYHEGGEKTAVCLGRVYGAGTHEGNAYVTIHPHSEPGDTEVVAQYAERQKLDFSRVLTLQELEASL